MHMHPERVDKIPTEKVIEIFLAKKARRLNFGGIIWIIQMVFLVREGGWGFAMTT